MIDLAMMMTCAPNVAPVTIDRIIQVENGPRDPLAINVNVKWVTERDDKGNPVMVIGENGQAEPKRRKVVFKNPIQIKTAQDAATVAYTAMAAGHSVDLGYMQVNSSNLQALGYSVEDMFDGCKNIAAGARVLTAFYSKALTQYPNKQAALWAALSAYNTGDFNKGYVNGYLARYGIGQQPSVSVPAVNSYTADTAVYVRQNPKKEEAMSTKEDASSTQQIAETATALAPRVDPVVSESPEDGGTPGVQIEHTAEAAEANGAFHETAMSEADAWESNTDLADDPNGTAIMLKGKVVRQAVKLDTSDVAKMKPESAAAIINNSNVQIPLKGGN